MPSSIIRPTPSRSRHADPRVDRRPHAARDYARTARLAEVQAPRPQRCRRHQQPRRSLVTRAAAEDGRQVRRGDATGDAGDPASGHAATEAATPDGQEITRAAGTVRTQLAAYSPALVDPGHSRSQPPWQRRTNIWHEVTILAQWAIDQEQRDTVVLTGRAALCAQGCKFGATSRAIAHAKVKRLEPKVQRGRLTG